MLLLVILMNVVVELFGYIESNPNNKEYIVGKSYNYGAIKGNKAVGGIVGGAWNVNGQVLTIKYCYNTGSINCSSFVNGGILGGTYNAIVETSTDSTKNIIDGCYSIGVNSSSVPNQISNRYATVTNSYYILGRNNVSGYGIGKADNQFELDKSDRNSVYYLLDSLRSGIWTKNGYNNGYVSLLWQKE